MKLEVTLSDFDMLGDDESMSLKMQRHIVDEVIKQIWNFHFRDRFNADLVNLAKEGIEKMLDQMAKPIINKLLDTAAAEKNYPSPIDNKNVTLEELISETLKKETWNGEKCVHE
jgi:hypothetical protein